jgi:hypothetical protein
MSALPCITPPTLIIMREHNGFGLLFAHDLRANAFAFVARENRYTLFRIMR